MREHVLRFFTALMFLTRIPCPNWSDHNPSRLANSSMYFPAVGIIVGGIGALAYRLAAWGYSPIVAAIAGIAATAIVTGAFHEDAVADVCDGFGGWTPTRRLEIMRDSRVGSYGVVGLVLLMGMKVALIGSLPLALAPLAFVAAHAFARWSSVFMMARYPAVSGSASLVKPFAGSIPRAAFVFATLLTALSGMLCGAAVMATMFVSAALLCLGAGRFFKSWLGGISGDCLGAINQIVEVVCYAVIVQMPHLQAGMRHFS